MPVCVWWVHVWVCGRVSGGGRRVDGKMGRKMEGSGKGLGAAEIPSEHPSKVSAGPPGCGLPGIYPSRFWAAILGLPGPRFFAVFSRFPEASRNEPPGA